MLGERRSSATTLPAAASAATPVGKRERLRTPGSSTTFPARARMRPSASSSQGAGARSVASSRSIDSISRRSKRSTK